MRFETVTARQEMLKGRRSGAPPGEQGARQAEVARGPPSPTGRALLRRRTGIHDRAMQRETTLDDIRTFKTRGGNVRFVVRDTDGNEYTTFREQIGEQARRLAGKRARVEFHEQQRGQYKNVYLDKVDPVAG